MSSYQLWLVHLLQSAEPVSRFMQMHWSWPGAESVHFLGLTLLFGSIGAWDLRLVGMASGVPIAAFHRLVPFAVVGFALNAVSGSMFLMTEPDQYIYNPAFHLKLLLIVLAGLNVLVFYATVFRRIRDLGPGAPVPSLARMSGAVSLACWMGVIVCGRMITFFRPFGCRIGEPIGFLADCIMR